MRFKLSFPDTPQYDFYLLTYNADTEAEVNRLGPHEIVTSAYDWPTEQYPYHGWVDTLNSLWWPRGGDTFATLILLVDDYRAGLVKACLEAQEAAAKLLLGTSQSEAQRPYLILQALLSPKEGQRPPDEYAPAGVTIDSGEVSETDETELLAWKLYPLPPVPLPQVDASDTFQGLWLLPLVDIRYFLRATALTDWTGGSAYADDGTGSAFPLVRVDHRDDGPAWMPPLRAYPTDAAAPADYVAIAANGTHPGVDGHASRGTAMELQAAMENWRVVCRDVRTNYNVPVTPVIAAHVDFTGVVCDYPDKTTLDLDSESSYHEDALRLGRVEGNLIAGGPCDATVLKDLVAQKLNVLFRVSGDDYYYSIPIQCDVLDPQDVGDLSEDANGLGTFERQHVPKVALGVEAGTRTPTGTHRDDLVAAAKQWAILYYRWRRKQAFLKFPGVAPVIPNGYAAVIRWDFSAAKFETTYVAVEGVEGTYDQYPVQREPRWGRIDGEGSISDSLDGYYAWTELEDVDGGFQVKDNGVVGYVKNVNGQTQTIQPARSDNDKRACPVGMRVWVKPGKPYLDATTGEIFDHWRFATDDLLQVVKLSLTGERNAFGHYGAVVRRWSPDLNDFVDSELIWVVLLS